MQKYLFLISILIASCQFPIPEALKTAGCNIGGISYSIDGNDTQRYIFFVNNSADIQYPITWRTNQGTVIGTSNNNSINYKFPNDGNYFITASFKSKCGDSFNINTNTFAVSSVFKINMISIGGGTFQMGSSEDNIIRQQPVHYVIVNNFKMSSHEISQAQYLKVMNANPSKLNCTNCPVTNVSWLQAVTFCNKLSQMENKASVYTIIIKTGSSGEFAEVTANFNSNGYRLPTEAEWEYAAGGGISNRTRFGNSTNIAKPTEINFNGIAANKISFSETGVNRGSIISTGSFSPNQLGLYDMAGNLSEWCNDWYKEDYYSTSPSTNPTGPVFINNSNQWRVIRGGSYSTSPNLLKVFNRNFNNYWGIYDDIGFRIVSN